MPEQRLLPYETTRLTLSKIFSFSCIPASHCHTVEPKCPLPSEVLSTEEASSVLIFSSPARDRSVIRRRSTALGASLGDRDLLLLNKKQGTICRALRKGVRSSLREGEDGDRFHLAKEILPADRSLHERVGQAVEPAMVQHVQQISRAGLIFQIGRERNKMPE